MNHTHVWTKAYDRLCELYGEYPDILILNRFYKEKMLMQGNDYILYIDLCSNIRSKANEFGEHIEIGGTVGSSFVAYLLGATDINPLPFHEYCPSCKRVRFTRKKESPFDHGYGTCSCGTILQTDGFNLPFEANLRSVLSETIQICVSHAFFKIACKIIRAYFADRSLIVPEDETEIAPVHFYLANEESATLGEKKLPHITLVPDINLDNLRKLELKTGIKNFEITDFSEVLPFFLYEGDISDIPHINSELMQELIEQTNPSGYNNFLKLIGFCHGTKIWKENAEIFFYEHKWSLSQIPAFREDLYDIICKKLYERGIYETGFAYEVALKTRQGYYAKNEIEDATAETLRDLGFDINFYLFLSGIEYMFPKSHAITYLKRARVLAWYKINYPEEYRNIFGSKEESKDGE